MTIDDFTHDGIIDVNGVIEQLNSWTKAYDEGHPEVDDKTWDNLYFELVELEKMHGEPYPGSPTKQISYTVVNGLNKVTHDHPMLSLAKTKELSDLEKFSKSHSVIQMLKLDGLTCSLTYENGRLTRAETRGNGEVGEDILHNAKVIKTIPDRIPARGKVVIDGEVICTYPNFESWSNQYKNPRNFASGSLRLLDSKECEKRNLTFVAWDLISWTENFLYHGGPDTLSVKLCILGDMGFEVVPFCLPIAISFEDGIEELKYENNTHYHYPIDGIVVKYDKISEYEAAGKTSHHFNGGLAYKFYDETYPTRLKYIDWTMGRTGQLTPTAVFEPIEIDGTTIERASLHNVSIMRETLGPCAYLGEPLEIYKANQIIPQIYSAGPHYNYGTVIANGGVSAHDVLERCPICGGEVEIRQDGIAEIYYCTNPSCEGKLLNQLNHFCGKKGMDIKGLSKATLEKLIDWGWVENYNNIYNLYLHESEWIKKPGFGPASVKKILDSIEKSRYTELWRVIAAAGIPEIGVTASKTLANYYKTWKDFRYAVFKGEDFSHLPDFGMIMNQYIHDYDFEVMDNVVSNIVFQSAELPDQRSLTGKQFCITGKVHKWNNRDSLKQYIEEHGGKVTGSVTSKTDYLINNELDSNTTKNQQAKKLGIPILSEEDFVALISDLLAF